jgi:hypothetical protein
MTARDWRGILSTILMLLPPLPASCLAQEIFHVCWERNRKRERWERRERILRKRTKKRKVNLYLVGLYMKRQAYFINFPLVVYYGDAVTTPPGKEWTNTYKTSYAPLSGTRDLK